MNTTDKMEEDTISDNESLSHEVEGKASIDELFLLCTNNII